MLLARLTDYYRFVSDDGKLRRYLFDSNVRDFMGLNRVNEDIKDTLDNDKSPDFWWLNNGVTILSTSASVIGKSIKLEAIQIVNGLQTTESVFRYFDSGGVDPNGRAVLIKIIVSKDEAVRDAIIRATNNQTDVELSSLHATDKIQRDVEDILARNGLYYERRKNYYINLGHLPSEIITPLYLASGYVSLILKSPIKAVSLRSKFMRSVQSYNTVFSSETPIRVWPKIASLLKKTDDVLDRLRPARKTANERFLKNWRHITCFITVARLIGKFDFSASELIELDMSQFTDGEIEATWEQIQLFDPKILNNNGWRRKGVVIGLCQHFSDRFGVANVQRVERGYGGGDYSKRDTTVVDMDFALKVHALLPPQPWKPGIHKEIIRSLNCTGAEYFSAVRLLIDEGLRNRQKDGVVYDSDGNVISFDSERVNPDSLTLFDDAGNEQN